MAVSTFTPAHKDSGKYGQGQLSTAANRIAHNSPMYSAISFSLPLLVLDLARSFKLFSLEFNQKQYDSVALLCVALATRAPESILGIQCCDILDNFKSK